MKWDLGVSLDSDNSAEFPRAGGADTGSTDLEHVLFRDVLDLSFPFATRPFVLFLIYNLLKMSVDRALAMPRWNLL